MQELHCSRSHCTVNGTKKNRAAASSSSHVTIAATVTITTSIAAQKNAQALLLQHYCTGGSRGKKANFVADSSLKRRGEKQILRVALQRNELCVIPPCIAKHIPRVIKHEQSPILCFL